jgi:hypothetical protein
VRLLGAKLESIGSRAVRVRRDDVQEAIPADTVIIASGEVPDTRLAVALRSAGVPVRTIGDCREVRHLEGANRDDVRARRNQRRQIRVNRLVGRIEHAAAAAIGRPGSGPICSRSGEVGVAQNRRAASRFRGPRRQRWTSGP